MKRVEFLYDFGSPNAYLAHKALPEIAARAGAEIVHVPILLGGIFKATGNQSPAAAYAHIPAKLAYEMKEIARFVARHRIAFRMNPFFPVNTLTLMRGAIAAARLAVAPRYVDAVFDAMWRSPRNMGDPDTARAAIEEAGLDAAAILALAGDAAVKAELTANTERAAARGVFGAPSFFIGDELWFGKDRLRDLEDHLVSGG